MSHETPPQFPDDPAALIGMWGQIIGDPAEESSPHMSAETPNTPPPAAAKPEAAAPSAPSPTGANASTSSPDDTSLFVAAVRKMIDEGTVPPHLSKDELLKLVIAASVRGAGASFYDPPQRAPAPPPPAPHPGIEMRERMARAYDARMHDAPPMMARRTALPLNSLDRQYKPMLCKPGESVEIHVRPQRGAYRPERLFVSDYRPVKEMKRAWWKRVIMFWRKAPEPGGAADWEILDIRVGGKSQFAQAGALPGDMFSNMSIDSFVSFDVCQLGEEITLVVRYNGPVQKGVPFIGGMLGTSAVSGLIN